MKYMECPKCGDKLNPDARACACGWKRVADSQSNIPTKDTQCTFTFAGSRCRHPVGFFDTGMSSGWCIFHRSNPSQDLARDIVHDSIDATPEQYMEMAKKKTYGVGDSHEVAKIRAMLTETPPPSSFTSKEAA